MKIVVRGTNWIGDAVMQIPALRELRRIFPDAKITLHTRSWAKGIFEDADFIDEILTFEKEKAAFKTVLAQAKILKEKNFDLAVLFPNSFKSALVAKLGRIPKRFGYAKEGRSFLLTDAVKIPEWKNEKHEVFYYLNLVAKIEKKFFGTRTVLENAPRFELNVSEERRMQARRILEENGVDLSKKIVAFCPGSTNSRAKRWHKESYARLNDKIQSELKANVILIGVSDELDVSMEVAAKSNLKPIVLTGKTALAEVVAVLSICDLLVSNDTGPAHVSAAAGTKTLVIFGPTNPQTTKPWNSEIIYKKVECSPCMLRDCPIDHRCMTRVLPEEVFVNAKEKLTTNEHG
ncbi:MAG: lipopolysaccharide heptosyltransferase II [Acidobacteria bacterium]|nr:lipopolysaccharide heptosyltransferase II [Acidobacteriota bacterium]